MNTIFFDLGNVLLFFNHEKMFENLSRLTQIPISQVRECMKERLLTFESGLLTSQDLYHYLTAQTSHLFSYDQTMHALSDIFTPNFEAFPVVKELKTQGHRLVLLSNISEPHFKFVRSHYDILDPFDAFILSYEVGACKPDPLIFQKALQEVKGKNFYTDDIPAYVAAGRKAGLDAEVFTDVPSLRRHLKERRLLPS